MKFRLKPWGLAIILIVLCTAMIFTTSAKGADRACIAADEGELREAIESGESRIYISVPEIDLLAPLEINSDLLLISASNEGVSVLKSAPGARHFSVSAENNVSLGFTGIELSGESLGGGIQSTGSGGKLSISGAVIYNCAADRGAAVESEGDMMLQLGEIRGNEAYSLGGGIYCERSVSIEDTVLQGNKAVSGSAVYAVNLKCWVTIKDSFITDNISSGMGTITATAQNDCGERGARVWLRGENEISRNTSCGSGIITARGSTVFVDGQFTARDNYICSSEENTSIAGGIFSCSQLDMQLDAKSEITGTVISGANVFGGIAEVNELRISTLAEFIISGTVIDASESAYGGIFRITPFACGKSTPDSIIKTLSGGKILAENTSSTGDSTLGGCISLSGGVNLDIKGSVEFSGNEAYCGGAVFIEDGAVFTAVDSKFTGNCATLGGAIASSGDSCMNISGAEFSENKAKTRGGAIHVLRGRLNLQETEFCLNDADEGGAIYIDGIADVYGSKFTDNKDETGESICASKNSDVCIENSSISVLD